MLRNVADAVFTGITMRLYFIRSSNDVTVESSDERDCVIGPQENYAPEMGGNGPASGRPAERVTFDGCLFRDMTVNAPGCSGQDCPHVDCMTVGDADSLVVRNSVFRNCWHISLILADDLNGKAARNFLIENNLIGDPVEPGGSLMIGSTDGPGTIRFNSVGSSLAWTGGDVAPGARIHSNVFGSTRPRPSRARWAARTRTITATCGQMTRLCVAPRS